MISKHRTLPLLEDCKLLSTWGNAVEWCKACLCLQTKNALEKEAELFVCMNSKWTPHAPCHQHTCVCVYWNRRSCMFSGSLPNVPLLTIFITVELHLPHLPLSHLPWFISAVLDLPFYSHVQRLHRTWEFYACRRGPQIPVYVARGPLSTMD